MRNLTWQGIRYLLVGGLNTLFTLVVFWLLDWLFSQRIGVQGAYWTAAAIGIVNGFVWQRLLVWRSQNRWHSEFLRFLAVNITVSVANSLLLQVAVGMLHYPAFPSQVVLTALLIALSFLVTRGWVFRMTHRLAAQPPPPAKPRIDVFLQYYKPHTSGLTNAAADIAVYAALHGLEVHVHCVSLVREASTEERDGVTIHSYRRSFSLGRGTFSFQLVRQMWRMRNDSGIAHAHMPYPESFLLAWILGPDWSFMSTYQCDAPMTGGLANLIARALDGSHKAFMKRGDAAVASSADYADHSRLRKVMAENGGTAIAAPSIDRRGGNPVFAKPGTRYVGFLGRPTSEKGIDVVLGALDLLPPDICLLQAGPVVGLTEKASFDRAHFVRLSDAGRIRSLGFLEDEQIADFYASLNVFLLPSTNSFEAFGIVQVEAISAGTPVVASNLPGVRTIVHNTGFGEVAEVGDSADFARCILTALESSYDKKAARRALDATYLTPKPERAYLKIYDRLIAGGSSDTASASTDGVSDVV